MGNILRILRLGLLLPSVVFCFFRADPLIAAPAGIAASAAGATNRAAIIRTNLSSSNTMSSVAFSNSQKTLTNLSASTGAGLPLTVEHADNLEYFRVETVDEDIIRLTGSIVLNYGKIRLKADRIAVNMKTRMVYGRGRVQIQESWRTLIGEGFFYDLKRERGVVYRGASVIDQILYRGEEIKTLDDGFYRITDGLFSTCAYERPHFYIEAKKLWIYPDRSFFILNLFYRTGGVRIFYFPFAFRTTKGTGIDTFAGYSSSKGYYIQNSYPFPVGRYLNARVMADYYQFFGPYAGLLLKSKKGGSDAEISLNYAFRRSLRPDGKYDSVSRWLGSAKEDLTLGKAGTGTNAGGVTSLRFYYFDAGDNYFGSDYMVDRSMKSGVGLFGLDRFRKSSLGYYVNQNSRYLNISHKRGNLYVSVNNNWGLHWNDALKRYTTTVVVLPSVSGQYGGSFSPYHSGSNASFGQRLLDVAANRFSWSVNGSVNNTEYFDYASGSYKKTQRSRTLSLGLAKSFNFFNYFVYTPRMTVGDVRWSGLDLTADEKANFVRQSYAFLGWSERWTINPLAFWKKPVVTTSFSLDRQYQAEIFRPEDRQPTEYGDIRSHRMSAGWNLGIRPPNPAFIPTITYAMSASADLMTKTNVRLDPFAPDRYGNLLQTFSLSLGSWLNVRDIWSYSIPKDQSTMNTATISASVGKFRIGFMKFDSLSANLSWNNSFANVRQNNLTAGYSFSFSPFPTFRMSVSVNSKNENLYLYDRSTLNRFHYSPAVYRNVLDDLADSFDFFDIAKRRKSNFKLQGISISFTHDLHCWELKGGYSLHQAYISLPELRYARYPYWEHSFWIQIDLKAYQSVRYRQEETTAPPKVE